MAVIPRLVLVHGSVVGGRATWREQRRAIRPEQAELVVLERPGFGEEPDGAIDFERHADWVAARIRPGDHLVGHSYGGVIALLATAARGSELGSLAVIEPPCTSVALDEPAVSAFADAGAAYWRDGPRDDPEAFLRGFLASVGSDYDPPSPLPVRLARGARALVTERGPWEAEIPLDRIAALAVPTLVVSGAHHAAFEAICNRLERALSAERLVLPGHGHNPQLDPRFTHELLALVEHAERERDGTEARPELN